MYARGLANSYAQTDTYNAALRDVRTEEEMRRELTFGGISFIMCMVCLMLVFIVGPRTPAAPGLLVFGGAFYGFAAGIASRYMHADDPVAAEEEPPNAAFTENQQREIDTTYEQLKQKIQANASPRGSNVVDSRADNCGRGTNSPVHCSSVVQKKVEG
jgi:hypothetical protein